MAFSQLQDGSLWLMMVGRRSIGRWTALVYGVIQGLHCRYFMLVKAPVGQRLRAVLFIFRREAPTHFGLS